MNDAERKLPQVEDIRGLTADDPIRLERDDAERVDKAEAANAEMRNVLQKVHQIGSNLLEAHVPLPSYLLKECEHVLSTSCGEGWVSPESNALDRETIEKLSTKLAEVDEKLEQALAECDQARAEIRDLQETRELLRKMLAEARAEAAAAVEWVRKAPCLRGCSSHRQKLAGCDCGWNAALNGTAAKAMLAELQCLRTEAELCHKYHGDDVVLAENKQLAAENEKLRTRVTELENECSHDS